MKRIVAALALALASPLPAAAQSDETCIAYMEADEIYQSARQDALSIQANSYKAAKVHIDKEGSSLLSNRTVFENAAARLEATRNIPDDTPDHLIIAMILRVAVNEILPSLLQNCRADGLRP